MLHKLMILTGISVRSCDRGVFYVKRILNIEFKYRDISHT